MIDSMGHLNNAVYLTLFEEARWEWMTRRGFGYDYIQSHQLGFTVLEAHLKYLQEITLRERIEISCQFTSYKKKIGIIDQTITRSDKSTDPACQARFTIGLFDLKKRRLLPPSSDWLKAMGLSSLYQP